MRVEQVQLKDAYLGVTSWSAHDVFIVPDGGNPPAGLRGLLGVSSLGARRVGFDPERQIIAWDRESRPKQIALRQNAVWLRFAKSIRLGMSHVTSRWQPCSAIFVTLPTMNMKLSRLHHAPDNVSQPP